MKQFTRFFIIVTIIIAILDQLTKYLIRSSSINYVKNYGAGFGILQHFTLFLIIISILIFILIIIFYKRMPRKRAYQTFFALILGGLIGNLIDRIVFGYVIDFIDLGFWPSFNIADTALSIGVIGLIIWMLREK